MSAAAILLRSRRIYHSMLMMDRAAGYTVSDADLWRAWCLLREQAAHLIGHDA